MEYEKLEYFISAKRLERYLVACNHSKVYTSRLYSLNMKLSQAFYPLLSMTEIFLRNSINNVLTAYFSDPNWIVTQKSGFMNDSLLFPKYVLRESIHQAEHKIKERGDKITAGKIIAEQSLGFWVSLYYKKHYKLLKGSIIKCFPHKESGIKRHDIYQSLDHIRTFRNRIYHNEPICFDNKCISFRYPKLMKDEIYKIMAWMDPCLISYINEFDDIDYHINSGEKLRKGI